MTFIVSNCATAAVTFTGTVTTVPTAPAGQMVYNSSTNQAMVSTGCGWSSVTAGTLATSGQISLSGPKPAIKTDRGEIDLNLLLDMMSQIKDILCIVQERVDLNEEYPALKNIYDQYRIVEEMVKSDKE
jgi:hypothetical protein